MKIFILLLWLMPGSVMAAWCPLLPNSPTRVTIKHAEQSRQAEAYIRAVTDGASRLQLVTTATGHDLAALDLSSAGMEAEIIASPLAEDANLDGSVDHFWLLTRSGQVWRIPWQQNQFGSPQLLADLSDSHLQFHSAVALVRARLPSNLAPLSWRNLEQHQLLLLGTDLNTGRDTLFNLRFAVGTKPSSLVRGSQLLDRTRLSDDESLQLSAADWRVLLTASGWKLQLSGRVSSVPKVIAGVIYAPAVAVTNSERCEFESSEQQLYAIQLYTASQVYPRRSWLVPYLEQATLRIKEQTDKRLVLVLADERQSIPVVESLLKITTECHYCTAPLTLDKFPLWQRLATYRDERGAY